MLAAKDVIMPSSESRQVVAHRETIENGPMEIEVTDLTERIGSLILPDKRIMKCF